MQPVHYQCKIKLDRPLPHPFPFDTFWVKADMLATVALDRLDLFRTERDQMGKRKYLQPKVGIENVTRIRKAILHALAMDDLTIHLT